MKLEEKATSLGLSTHIVLDAGKTQVAAGSATVLTIMGMPLCLFLLFVFILCFIYLFY